MALKNRNDANRIVGFVAGDRTKGDFFATPTVAIEKLLLSETFGPLVLEPCCGDGAISEVLKSAGKTVISSDLYDWGYGKTGVNYLDQPVNSVDAVITNPPFNLSAEFTVKAMTDVKANNGKVAMLNRLQWLEGQRRRKMFDALPLSKVLVFSKRIPRMHRFDFVGKPSTSILAFAWFIFDWKHIGPPILAWI